MFWKVLLIALTLGLAVPSAANAQGQTSLKIGYMDSEEIIKAAPGYTEANDAFNRTAGALAGYAGHQTDPATDAVHRRLQGAGGPFSRRRPRSSRRC